MKKIVLVNQHAAYLFVDIVNAFSSEYNEVILLAGVVHPLGNELDPKVKVHPIIPYNIKSTFTRLWSWIFGFLQVWWLLLTRYRDHEVFLYSNPPLLTFLPLLLRRKISHLIVDVYPDALVTTGTLSNNSVIIYRIWAWLNRISLTRFYSVSTITNAMARKIEQYIDIKIPVVQLWTDSSFSTLEIDKDENIFYKQNNLDPKKTYVVYSGNLGKGHDVEFLVDVANITKDNPNIFYIIAGNGFKKDLIINKINHLRLSNCIWLPYQDREIFHHMMAAIDIGVVTIDEPNAYVSIPSKTFNLLGAGKPILCFGKTDSELGLLVKNSNAGKIFDQEGLNECANFVEELTNNKNLLQMFSVNAKEASKEYTSANAFNFLELHTSALRSLKNKNS